MLRIPGPRGREALQFLGFGSADGMLAYFARLARKYGPIVSFRDPEGNELQIVQRGP